MIFKTHVFSFYCHLCICKWIQQSIYTQYNSTGCSPWVIAIWVVLEDVNHVKSEIHVDMVSVWIWRCICRPLSSEFGDALGGNDEASLEMHVEAMILRTWRPWWTECGHSLGGNNRLRLEQYLEVVDPEAVDGRNTGCWESIHRLVNLEQCQLDKVTVNLSSHGQQTGGGRSQARHTWSWSDVLWQTCTLDTERMSDHLRWMLFLVYVIPGVYCTWCELMVMAWPDTERQLNIVFCKNGRVVDRKETWWIKMGTIGRIWVDMRNQGYNLHDWVLEILSQCSYIPDWELYLLIWKWYITFQTKLS